MVKTLHSEVLLDSAIVCPVRAAISPPPPNIRTVISFRAPRSLSNLSSAMTNRGPIGLAHVQEHIVKTTTTKPPFPEGAKRKM